MVFEFLPSQRGQVKFALTYKNGAEASGHIKLRKGLHLFRLYTMIEGSGNNSLALMWASDTLNKQQIPATDFYH